MPYKRKRSSRRTAKSAKKYSTGHRRRRSNVRRYARHRRGPSHINVSNNGINSSIMNWRHSSSKFDKNIAKRYRQGVNQFYQVVTNGQLYADSSNNMQAVSTVYLYSYSDMSTALGSTGNPGAPGTVADADNTKKVMHNSCYGELRLKNSSNCQSEVDIYICRVKSDANLPPESCWGYGDYDENTTTTTSYGVTTNAYTVPYTSIAFNTYYQPVKVFHLEMQPGQGARINIAHHLDKVVQSSILSGSYSSILYYKKYTYAIMMVARGTPVSSTVSLGSGITKVGLSPTTIDWTLSKNYKYKVFSNLASVWYYLPPTYWAPPSAEVTYNLGSGAINATPVNI